MRQNEFLNEVVVSYNATTEKKNKISNPADAVKIFKALLPVSIEHREAFTILFLDRANNTIGHFTLSIGGLSATIADRRLIFQTALKVNAHSLILCHNHPSGNLKPSEADKKITRDIVLAGELIDILVLDHMIITADNYTSFKEENLI